MNIPKRFLHRSSLCRLVSRGPSASAALLALLLVAACGPPQAGEVIACREIPPAGGPLGAFPAGEPIEGAALAAVGDIDSDGNQDLVVGSPNDPGAPGDEGCVRVLFLDAEATLREHRKIRIRDVDASVQAVDLFGCALASPGDIDGDGIPDLAIGAARVVDDAGDDEWRGAAWTVLLRRDGSVKAGHRIGAGHGVEASEIDPMDRFGGSSLAGIDDVDGDGVPDLAVGAHYDDDGAYDLTAPARYAAGGGQNKGAVWIVLLNRDGTAKATQKISESRGGFVGPLQEAGYFGSSVAGLGDLDGDGLRELAVGATYHLGESGQRGVLWLLSLRPDGTVAHQQQIGDGEGGYVPDPESDCFGSAIAALGDLDGDGATDLAVGAYDDSKGLSDRSTRGAVWILRLDRRGRVVDQRRIGHRAGGVGSLPRFAQFGVSLAWLPGGNSEVCGRLVVGNNQDDDRVLVLDLARGQEE